MTPVSRFRFEVGGDCYRLGMGKSVLLFVCFSGFFGYLDKILLDFVCYLDFMINFAAAYCAVTYKVTAGQLFVKQVLTLVFFALF